MKTKNSKFYRKVKQRTFQIITVDEGSYMPSKIFDLFMMALIIISIISVIISTFDNVPSTVSWWLTRLEYVSITAFTFEYIARVWTADIVFPDKGIIMSRVKYIFSFLALIDFISILPFYLPFITNVDLRSLRALRLFRMFRIFKSGRYFTALTIIVNVLKRKKEQLVSSITVVAVLMLISSIIIYFFEHDAQPTVFSNAFSGLWWSIATLTTVGYGDIYPITIMGKILSAFIAILGIGIVAVPTGIISAGFNEDLDEEKQSDADDLQYCPYCGKKLKK